MTDQTTYISPDLQLAYDESGNAFITLDGTLLHPRFEGDPNVGNREVFRILAALTYTHKDYSDGSVGYWANFRDGSEFWAVGDTLRDVIEYAADCIGMYLTGRDGYPLFNGILDLDAVK